MRRLRYATTKFLLFVILSLNFFSLSCGNSAAELGKTDVIIGERAHDFTLKDLNGNSVSLADFRGKKSVLLICTTTWCPSCITIIPELKEIHSKYKSEGLEVIAMYINEPENKVKAFNRKFCRQEDRASSGSRRRRRPARLSISRVSAAGPWTLFRGTFSAW